MYFRKLWDLCIYQFFHRKMRDHRMTEHGVEVDDDGGEKTPDILQLLEDIKMNFEQLKKLRKDYRAALPQLRKLGEGYMDKFLRTYAKLEISLLDDVTVSQLKKKKKVRRTYQQV